MAKETEPLCVAFYQDVRGLPQDSDHTAQKVQLPFEIKLRADQAQVLAHALSAATNEKTDSPVTLTFYERIGLDKLMFEKCIVIEIKRPVENSVGRENKKY